MKFEQNKDGSCNIFFEEHEIEIIKNKHKLHLTDIALRHLGNTLIKIVSEWNKNFNSETSKVLTYDDTKINGS